MCRETYTTHLIILQNILKLQKFSVARLTTPAAQAFYFHNLFQSFDISLQQIIAQSIYYTPVYRV